MPTHSSPHESLGVELARSGNEFGPETQYGLSNVIIMVKVTIVLPYTLGGYLVRCAEVENKIGQSEKNYQSKINSEVIVPLRSFLEVDIKNVLVRG